MAPKTKVDVKDTAPTPKGLPEAFLVRMARLLGDEYPAFLASYEAPPFTGLRVNTLKLSPEALLALTPFDLRPIPWCPEGFLVSEEAQPSRHPHHAAGLYYLQDPSAMAVVPALAPRPGERILDLCAAPGGKATHLVTWMGNQGLLIANDIHQQRARILAENLERWGARNAVVLSETPHRLAARFPAFFDRVLVDAPCSCEGMFRKSERARLEWQLERVKGCALRQVRILASAAQMVRPGGLLAYSTCTFAPEENEGVVADLLRHHTEFEVVEGALHPGFAPGRPDWLGECPQDLRRQLERTIRLWPHRLPGEGHFIALLRRCGDEGSPAPAGWRGREAPARIRRLYEAFCREHLANVPAWDRLTLFRSDLYQYPLAAPDLSGLRVIRPGWRLGAVRRGRFEPSHALALGLTRHDVRQVLELPAEGDEVTAYLRGEPLRTEGPDGWVLVTVNGHPLGWGKRARNIVKNRYPRGWRWTP